MLTPKSQPSRLLFNPECEDHKIKLQSFLDSLDTQLEENIRFMNSQYNFDFQNDKPENSKASDKMAES
jgi:hypothetical protein